MKLGLIQALDPEKTGIFDYEYPPMGLLYIASYLKEKLDLEILLTQEISRFVTESPDIIGISANSINFKEAIKISEEIKKKLSIPLIIGGPHITILPWALPETVDIGVIGEGEETMLEILKLYIKEKRLSVKDLAEIKGIVFKEGNSKKITPSRELIDPLDLIPTPDRKLDPDTDFTPCIITSRGCPYKCSFCSLSSCWQKFRSFSTDYIKDELIKLVEGIDSHPHIRILDDVFALDMNRLRDIKDFIIKNSIQNKVSFDCSVRAEIFTEEMCKILKEMNVTRILLGAESGSQKILKYYKKGQTVNDIQRVIDLCFKYDIELTASFIIGSPVETAEDLRETYNIIKKNSGKFWKVHINPLDPLPGTQIWEYAKKRGLVSDEDKEIKSLNLSEHITDVDFLAYINIFDELICQEIEKRFSIGLELMNDFYG